MVERAKLASYCKDFFSAMSSLSAPAECGNTCFPPSATVDDQIKIADELQYNQREKALL